MPPEKCFPAARLFVILKPGKPGRPGRAARYRRDRSWRKRPSDLLTFGEIMLRLSPPRHARIVDGDVFEKRAGGSRAERGVRCGAAGPAHGHHLPSAPERAGHLYQEPHSFRGRFRRLLCYDNSPSARLGIYYYEMGAAPRKPTIVYDRFNASVCGITLEDIPEEAFLRPGCSTSAASAWRWAPGMWPFRC